MASALGELKRVTLLGVLDMWELRRITHDHLRDFSLRMKALTKPERLKEFGQARVIDAMLTEFDGRLAFAVRQFDVGFEDPPLPEEPQVTNNSIQIQNNLGNIQQATIQSTQVVSGEVDTFAVRRAVDALEVELSNASAATDLGELRAELATIKAQLSKASPSASILIECAKSIRNLGEGVLAGAMTNRAVQLVTDLMRTLGLG